MEVKIPRTWDEIEVRYLIKHAGRDTVHDIASVLERSRHDVRRECAIRGLNARAPKSALTICPSCGKARTRLVPEIGACRVCACREYTSRAETRIALELASAPLSVRGDYGRFLGKRGGMAPPPRRPLMPRTVGMTPKERQMAEDEYDAAMEQVELIVARREYDAARQQLHRLRVALNDRRP